MAEVAVSVTAKSGATLSNVRGRGVMRLRSWESDCGIDGRALRVADVQLPSRAGAVWSGPVRVLCIAPGEWLVTAEARGLSVSRETIEAEVAAIGLAVVDLSEALAILELRGPAAREVLSKGSGLDFHRAVFVPDSSARTRLAQVPVLVDCRGEPERFDLYVARSYLEYLRTWLEDAGAVPPNVVR